MTRRGFTDELREVAAGLKRFEPQTPVALRNLCVSAASGAVVGSVSAWAAHTGASGAPAGVIGVLFIVGMLPILIRHAVWELVPLSTGTLIVGAATHLLMDGHQGAAGALLLAHVSLSFALAVLVVARNRRGPQHPSGAAPNAPAGPPSPSGTP